MTADLSTAGHEVNMYELPIFEENTAATKILGRIDLVVRDSYGNEFTSAAGGRTGVVEITGKVTYDIKEAVEGVDVIMVVVPAFGQRAFIDEFIPYLEDGQIVVFNPGNLGSLEFTNLLKERRIEKDILIGETECLVYATRVIGPARVWVKAVKDEVLFSAIPAKNTERVLKTINEVFPQFKPAENVFYTSINNINFVLHTCSTILNASRIEQYGAYKQSHYEATPSVGRVMEAVDREKIEVSKALGLEPVSTKDILRRYYEAKGETFYETLLDCKTYKTQTGPASLTNRYITEDVPYGLVPIASLGNALSVATPTIKALIQMASIMNQTDYWQEGRTVEKLGLAGMSAKEMIGFVS